MPLLHIEHIQSKLKKTEVDGALLTDRASIQWATGFTGSNSIVVFGHSNAHFFTDHRYDEQAHREVKEASVHVPGYDLFGAVAELSLLKAGAKVVIQAEHVTLDYFQQLQLTFPEVEWYPISGWLQEARAQKNEAELASIAQAQNVTDRIYTELLEWMKPGMTELQVAAELVYRAMRSGAQKMSFDPIVASGPNSALPHAKPTNRVIGNDDVVLIDFGVVIDGYCSDMTRTVKYGSREELYDAVYETVLEAQIRAIETVKEGVMTDELDSAARDIIHNAGYGNYFGHSLGHGVGLEIHEWPSVSWRSKNRLTSGMVITIEPGIYLPGKFGIRIEDLVCVEKVGAHVFTQSAKAISYL